MSLKRKLVMNDITVLRLMTIDSWVPSKVQNLMGKVRSYINWKCKMSKCNEICEQVSLGLETM